MNKRIVRRMIKRIGSVPQSFDQRTWFIARDDEAPCGTVACLAGEAVICSAKTIQAGIKLAFEHYEDIPELAGKLLGLPDTHSVFATDGSGWPQPYDVDFAKAADQHAKAEVCVAYLREALKRGTMIWQPEREAK